MRRRRRPHHKLLLLLLSSLRLSMRLLFLLYLLSVCGGLREGSCSRCGLRLSEPLIVHCHLGKLWVVRSAFCTSV